MMQHVTRFKKMVIFLMAFVMICTTANVFAATTYKRGGRTCRYRSGSYKVYFNSVLTNTPRKPGVMINQNVMIPYKATLVKKGPKMASTYDKASKTLTLSYNGTTVKMTANKKKMYVNGQKVKLRTAPLFVNFSGANTLMVPAKAICQAFDLGYKYKKKKKAIYITAPTTTTNSPVAPQAPVADCGLTAQSFKGMSTSQFIAAMGPVAQADYHRSGVLASVTLAQAILESGWGKSTLAQNANNMFGMKTNLSGNTWAGSAWDGVSSYSIRTGEEYDGKHVTITASFRKYPGVAQSVADHSAYLVNAKNGSTNRYKGLTSTKNYKEQITIIKNGGYATSSTYISQLTSLIQRYHLDQYDR